MHVSHFEILITIRIENRVSSAQNSTGDIYNFCPVKGRTILLVVMPTPYRQISVFQNDINPKCGDIQSDYARGIKGKEDFFLNPASKHVTDYEFSLTSGSGLLLPSPYFFIKRLSVKFLKINATVRGRRSNSLYLNRTFNGVEENHV